MKKFEKNTETKMKEKMEKQYDQIAMHLAKYFAKEYERNLNNIRLIFLYPLRYEHPTINDDILTFYDYNILRTIFNIPKRFCFKNFCWEHLRQKIQTILYSWSYTEFDIRLHYDPSYLVLNSSLECIFYK